MPNPVSQPPDPSPLPPLPPLRRPKTCLAYEAEVPRDIPPSLNLNPSSPPSKPAETKKDPPPLIVCRSLPAAERRKEALHVAYMLTTTPSTSFTASSSLKKLTSDQLRSRIASSSPSWESVEEGVRFVSSLSPSDKSLLDSYSGIGYVPLNNFLRKNDSYFSNSLRSVIADKMTHDYVGLPSAGLPSVGPSGKFWFSDVPSPASVIDEAIRHGASTRASKKVMDSLRSYAAEYSSYEKELSSSASRLSSILRRAPRVSGTFFRGVRMPASPVETPSSPWMQPQDRAFERMHAIRISKLKPGDEFVERGFVSASMRPSIAEHFASSFSDAVSCVLRIRVPSESGARGVFLLSLNESEVVLPPSRFRVESVFQFDSGVGRILAGWIVDLTLLRPLPDPKRRVKGKREDDNANKHSIKTISTGQKKS